MKLRVYPFNSAMYYTISYGWSERTLHILINLSPNYESRLPTLVGFQFMDRTSM